MIWPSTSFITKLSRGRFIISRTMCKLGSIVSHQSQTREVCDGNLLQTIAISHKIKHILGCPDFEVAVKLVQQNKSILKFSPDKISRNAEFLFEKKVSQRSMTSNLWLLGLPISRLTENVKILEKMLPHDINDFIPLIQNPTSSLEKAQKIMLNEKSNIAEGNRIYYFSKRLEVEPILVSKHFATHMFIFKVKFDPLVENLNVMLEFNVSSKNILCDLWAFKYATKLIRSRLEECQKAKVDCLKLWMIRCTGEILERSVTLSQEKKDLLGGSTVIDYLSERLGYDVETTKSIVSRYEKVNNVRAVKIKDILDYLLIEEKFEPFQVASAIRLLCYSLENTKRRINELKKFGCRPLSLSVLYHSQDRYNKYLKDCIDQQEKSTNRK